jgi:cytochrome c peroxidase
MRRPLTALFGLAALALGLAAAPPPAWRWDLPADVAPPPVPADNPMNAAKVELGRRLFYDADLSLDGTLACANCHVQRHAFADSVPSRGGVDGGQGRRNAPGLANVAYLSPLTWADPRQSTLEKQVAVPVFGDHPVEMGMMGHADELVRRLSGDDCYPQMFRDAFPDGRDTIGTATIAKALAAFQRTLLSYRSPYDRDRAGEAGALPDDARLGKVLFEADCASCHAGPDLTDSRFHAIEASASPTDAGLAEVTGRARDKGKFRTPGLRNVALTAPYMHDGSASSLEAAIRRHAFAVPAVKALSARQSASLIAWLGAMTDPAFVSDPEFAYPDRICGKPG